MRTHSIWFALLGAWLSLSSTFTWAQSASAACPANAAAAAQAFFERQHDTSGFALDLLRQEAVRALRDRIEQMTDDRYSPRSRNLRAKVFSDAATKVDTLPDLDVVRAFLRRGAGSSKELAEVRARPAADVHMARQDVIVNYRLRQLFGASDVLTSRVRAFEVEGCWRLDVPEFLWSRFLEVDTELLTARPKTLPGRLGPPAATMSVAEVAREARAGWRELSYVPPGEQAYPVWISPTVLVSEKDVTAADASWSCESLAVWNGARETSLNILPSPSANNRLRDWAENHPVGLLALVLDGRVTAVFSHSGDTGATSWSVCLPGMPLGEGQRFTARLLGR